MTEFDFIFSVLAKAVALLLAGIFASAGFSKLQAANQNYYTKIISSYNSDSIYSVVSQISPRLIGWLEILIAMAILLPVTMTYGLIAAAAVLLIYMLMFIKQIRTGKADMDCGCAGPNASVKISSGLVIRNAVLIILTTLALASPSINGSLTFWLLSVLVCAISSFIYLSAEELIGNNQKLRALRESGL